ncbi:uncharacterized protein NDAI_0C03520 [Naumovozyma dairenensis CBS 421]|uniref:Ty3 transposon capsid-like protein domain-containing protein n=1 Tax=Naumovozyma dairenensis (strain ATCC 10597 / BCRC 20456 / CBS 421 / NBRC 0211 / NRRL Y-12639) TaxID=1071378 RepID=G0W8A1_NAUDC|nr:hypothetical protein NDAI_0C03520 [Naumovozyma dairenensis CBS 421]CCD24012.1 hypothetical protein NDAI_0C03520 [Naumovozyma dairenensis CBS 421]
MNNNQDVHNNLSEDVVMSDDVPNAFTTSGSAASEIPGNVPNNKDFQFNGQPEANRNIKLFLGKLKNHFLLKGVREDRRKIAFLVECLTDQALIWFDQAEKDQDLYALSYEEFVRIFTDHFTKEVDAFETFSELWNLGHCANATEHAQKFKSLVSGLKPGFASDELLCNIYVMRCQPDMRIQLMLNKPWPSLEHCMLRETTLEASINSIRRSINIPREDPLLVSNVQMNRGNYYNSTRRIIMKGNRIIIITITIITVIDLH